MPRVPDILYIEDEIETLDLIAQMLIIAGFPVRRAISGEDGLAELRRQKPDLVLLDLMMPGVSGWEVYRTMKTDPALADIPVIVITARIPKAGRVIIDGLPPVSDYITKPFDLDRLLRSVRFHLRDLVGMPTSPGHQIS